VVIKTAPLAELSDATLLRLEHEAEVLRAIDCPFVVPVLEIGRQGGELYMVMPLLEGITLAERIGRGPLSTADTLAVGQAVMSGLAVAHLHGVLHRDLKPANVVVRDTEPIEHVTLIDFGLPRTAQLRGSIRGLPVGTVDCVAPEQAGLLEKHLDERSDLYAAGAVLFECLAGRPPFNGDSVAAVPRLHATGRPPSLGVLAEGVPAALDEVVQRLLRKDPGDGYQSADAAHHDLREIADALVRAVPGPPVVLGLHERNRRVAAETLPLADRSATVLVAGRQIASALSEGAVFAAVEQSAAALLRGEHNLVVALGEDGRPRVADGGNREYSRALIERACATGATVILNEEDLRVDASESRELGTTRSVLCAPISVRGDLTACLYVTHDQLGGRFGEEEERVASFIAVLAGAALENAERFSEVHALLGSGQDISERKSAEAARARLAAIVDFSEDAIIAKSLDGVIETWNRGAQKLFGYAPEEAVGRPIAMLVPPERRDELAEIMASIKRGRHVDSLETLRVTKDGRVIDVSLRVSLVYDVHGRLVGASSISRDISRQKRLEAELRHTGRFFDLSRDLTMAADFDWGIRSVNPALEQILGWSVEEFLARPFLELVHPEDRDRTRDEAARLADGSRAAASFINRCQAKDGTYRWLDWNAIVPPDEPLIYAAGRDVTERRRAEAALASGERRMRQILETAHNAFVAIDGRGVITEWNPEAERTFGWSRAEALGREFAATIVPAEHRDEHRRGLSSFMAGGEGGFLGRLLEVSMLHRDGHEFPVELTTSCLETDEGYAFNVFLRDVSDRRRAEEELRRSKSLLADLVDSAPDAVVITDERGRITLVNAQTEKLFGYDRVELLGAPIEKLLLQHVDEGRDREPTAAVGTPPDLDLRGRRRDGTEFSVDVSLSVVKTSEGTLTTAFVRDFTERKRTQDLLAGAHEKALAASRLKSEFVANMSHEIRTPLNGVIGMSGLLLDTALDEEQREYAEAIDASAEALMAVISDILDFSKIEAGKLELDRHQFDLRELVEGVVLMLAASAHEKDHELIVWLADDLPSTVYGDAARIRQVLANLVSNAVKFTTAGEIVVRVTGEQRSESTIDVRFAVSDTGIGLDASALDRIFGAFSQADSSTTRRYGGSGLGLTIAKQLVSLMDGQLRVESTPGKGSTFWFAIPITAVGIPVAAQRAQRLAGTRVLVVDDNATNLAVLARRLNGLGMICATADGSGEAMRKLAAARAAGRSYQLAIVDCNMPVTDGVGLARAVRADPEFSSVRLVMMSSSGSGRAGAARAGVDGFVTKPVREAQLLSEIARVLDEETRVRAVDAPKARRRARRPPASKGPAILVAEDNPVNQRVATRMLERRGFRVDVASNGREAVDLHRRGHYDLILMDCQMPELDGYAATAEIRRAESPPNRTPIIAMTANALQGDRERCLAAGMDDYLGKPVRATDLETVLARVLAAAPTDDLPGEIPTGQRSRAEEDRSPTNAAVVDLSRLADAYGDDGVGRADTVAFYLKRSRAVIDELLRAIAGGDTEAAARAAHGLHGSSAVVGAVRLAAVAGEVGDAVAAGSTLDISDARAKLDSTFELTQIALGEKVEPITGRTERADGRDGE